MPPPKRSSKESFSPTTNEVYPPNPEHLTFATYQENASKKFSDEFIDAALAQKLHVGNSWCLRVKSFFDEVELTGKDLEVAANPQKIVDLYRLTDQVVRRNLGLVYNSNSENYRPLDDDKKKQINDGLLLWGQRVDAAAQEIFDISTQGKLPGQVSKETASTLFYQNMLMVDGKNILRQGGDDLEGFRSTIKFQEQFAATFIMAYTKPRAREKLNGQAQDLTKRIYLNPDLEVAPLIFEKILQRADEAQISAQIKFYPRTAEMQAASCKISRSETEKLNGIRGDGIVIYATDDNVEQIFQLVVDLAQEDPGAFAGRKTSKVPCRVGEGIAIGDEPDQVAGQQSLSSHRSAIVQRAINHVRDLGYQSKEARDYFRSYLAESFRQNGIKPDNMAFNLKT